MRSAWSFLLSSGVGSCFTSKAILCCRSSVSRVLKSPPPANVNATPVLPMRPVRPQRCRYTAASSGSA